MNFIALIVASAGVFVGSLYTLDKTVCKLFLASDEDVGIPLRQIVNYGGAGILCMLNILACIFRWSAFAPIMLLLFGLWQFVRYTKYSWIVAISLLVTGWVAAQPSGNGPLAWLLAILGAYVLTIISALIYAALSMKSYQTDQTAKIIRTELEKERRDNHEKK